MEGSNLTRLGIAALADGAWPNTRAIIFDCGQRQDGDRTRDPANRPNPGEPLWRFYLPMGWRVALLSLIRPPLECSNFSSWRPGPFLALVRIVLFDPHLGKGAIDDVLVESVHLRRPLDFQVGFHNLPIGPEQSLQHPGIDHFLHV